MSKVYNRLEGQAREWAISQRMPRAEYGERVKSGKQIRSNARLAMIAGDGTFGFNSRRRAKDSVKITKGTQGQYMCLRKSIARKKKNVCQLGSSQSFVIADKLLQKQQERKEKRILRRKNRNKKARRNR